MTRFLARAAWLAAAALAASAAHAVPTLSLAATPDPAVAGTTLRLDVLVADIADLYAWQYSLSFNPAVLQVLGSVEGPFLASGGGSTTFGAGTIDNTGGKLAFSYDSLQGAVPGVSGSGVLARINFNVVAAGSSALTFSNVVFLDSKLVDITVQAQNRSITAVPEPATWALFGLGLAGLALRRR